MKEKILELRKQGKSYKQIKKIIGCSLSTISYHCNIEQKTKSKIRNKKNRINKVISQKASNFIRRALQAKSDDFQRERKNCKVGKHLNKTFNYKDVIEKFGEKTFCYLTGRAIDLKNPMEYQFDHKIPISKGGSHLIDNLGIACRVANYAKSDMLVDEFVMLCKEVLEFNGYKVTKARSDIGFAAPVLKTGPA